MPVPPRIARLALIPGFLLALALAAPAAAGPYIVVEADSGKVLAQHDAGRQWYPASVTKLMTVYLTFRALRAGKVKLDTPLTVSETAHAQPPSKMGLQVGAQVTVDNALKMLMVKSANDVAVVLAEGVGGSLSAFVKAMNDAADDLGMNGTQFRNPNGLPDEEQVTTARDMAVLARALIREYPEHEMLFRIPAIQYGRRVMRNHNRLIDRFPGIDGMKTGFICSSGFNVVATAKRGDKHLIVVVFGARSSLSRAEDAARLFERGFGGPLALANLFAGERPTLEQVANVAVGPVDMREEMCDRRRRRGKKPLVETDLDEDADDPETKALLNNGPKQTLLIDLPPSMPPIRVWAGLKQPAETKATETRSRKTRVSRTKKTKATADVKPKAKATEAKSTEAKAKPKTVTGKAKTKESPKPATTAPEPKPAPTRVSTPAPAPRPGG